jgi:hypothetical protein
MNVKELQAILKIEVDGKVGKETKEAISNLLSAEKIKGYAAWDKDQQLVAAEQIILQKEGIEVGDIDGLVGPQTRYARDIYASRKKEKTAPSSEETWRDGEEKGAVTKKGALWPTEKKVAAFYGHVGANQTSIYVPYPLTIAWNTSQKVKKITCHKKVSEATRQVLESVKEHYGMDEIKRLRLDLFGGSLNVRKKRGGSSWSMHSWGIAFDFDPERNQLKWRRNKASFAKKDYDYWHQAWEAAGAINLGRERDYDWMHTQFAII